MAQRYTSMKDIVNNFETIDELIEWALENQMQDHPLINLRINNYINQFENAEDLTEWEIHNNILNDQHVLNRIKTLYTCKWYGRRSESTQELRIHEHVHLMCDEIPHTDISSDNITHPNIQIPISCNNDRTDIFVSTHSHTGAGVTLEPPYIFRQSGQKHFLKT